MNDLIEKQAAIDAAIEAADEWDGGYDNMRADMIADAIRALPPAQTEQRWISINERPPKNGYCLWTVKSGEVQKDFYFCGHWENAEIYGYEVVAWMPLPEPYKGE